MSCPQVAATVVLLPLGITLLSNTEGVYVRAREVLLPLGITLLSNQIHEEM